MTDRSRTVAHPGLDGLRGLAVLAVLLYHSGFVWARGGYLGVSVFFTLSGYLITSLLLGERERTGAISLTGFWQRRFRRLIPASLAALAGVCVFGFTVASPEQRADLAGDVGAALFGVANWRFIFQDVSYGDLFAAPSPVLHFWSLAIEMQFYVLFPVLVIGALAVGRGRRWPVGALIAVLIAASVGASFLLASDRLDRIYFGTGTRAAELLVGALLAVAVASWGSPRGRSMGRASTGAGIVAVLVLGYACATVAQDSEWLYRGGFALIAVVSAVAVLSLARTSRWGATVGAPPLRWLGLRSYGIYLYHWPLFLWLTAELTGLDPWPLLGLRLAVTFALAEVSYHLIEGPVRRKAIPHVGVRVFAPAAVGVVTIAILLSVTAPPPALVFRTTVADAPEVPAAVAEPNRLVVVGGRLAGQLSESLEAVADPATTDVVDATIDGCTLPDQLPAEGVESCADVEQTWIAESADAATVVMLVGPGDPLGADAAALGRIRGQLDEDVEVVWVTHPLVGPWATTDPLRAPESPFGMAASEDAESIASASNDVVTDLAEAAGDTVIDLSRNLEPPPVGDPPAVVRVVVGPDDPEVVGALAAAAEQILDRADAGPTTVRILFVGDSIGQTMATGFVQWGQETGRAQVWDVTRAGCSWIAEGQSDKPLSQSEGCLAWAEDFPRYISEFDPDLILVQQGTWDLRSRRFDGDQADADATDPRVVAALDSTYRGALAALQADGAQVVWLDIPCFGPSIDAFPNATESRQVHDDVITGLADELSGVDVMDLDELVCPEGTYTSEVGGIDGSRPDEVHFSPAAARWLAGELAARMTDLTGIQLSDG